MDINDLYKVKDKQNFYRDPVSKAIIINDEEKRNAYLTQRDIAMKQKLNEIKVNNDINNIKSELDDIKSVLTELITIIKQNKE